MSSASRAHGTQSSRPPRLQPPCHPRPPGAACPHWPAVAESRFHLQSAQYNPAAALWRRGLGAHDQGVEERGGQGGRGSPAALTRPRPRGGAATASLWAQVVCFGSGRPRPPGFTNRERARGWGVCVCVLLCGGPARSAAQVGASGLPRPWSGLLRPEIHRVGLPGRANTLRYPRETPKMAEELRLGIGLATFLSSALLAVFVSKSGS